MRTVLSDLNHAFTVLDGNGQTVYANKAFADQLGYSVESILQLDVAAILSLIHPDDRQHVEDTLNHAIREQRCTMRYRYRARQGGGQYVLFEDRVRLFYEDDGNLDQAWIISMPIDGGASERIGISSPEISPGCEVDSSVKPPERGS
jgi:PAS domain S-box-containing protein